MRLDNVQGDLTTDSWTFRPTPGYDSIQEHLSLLGHAYSVGTHRKKKCMHCNRVHFQDALLACVFPAQSVLLCYLYVFKRVANFTDM